MAKKFPPGPAKAFAAPTDNPSVKLDPAGFGDEAKPFVSPFTSETPRLREPFKESIRRPAVLGSEPVAPKTREARVASTPFWIGIGATTAWFGAVAAIVFDASGTVFGFPISNVALALSGVVAPPALLWMVIAYLQRASDIRTITEPLRRQLQMVLGTGAQAENRVRRFNDALEKQLELLRQAGDGSYDVLQGAIQVLQEEEQAIHALTERSSKEVSRVAGVVRDNSEILEDLLHSNRERFNDLSASIGGHIATLDDKADQATTRLSDVVDRLHNLIAEFLSTADKKLDGFTDISGQVGAQEKESAEAARRMADMLAAARAGATELNSILAKNQEILETSGSRLLSRMQEVSAETEAFAIVSDAKERELADKSRNLSQTLAREIATLETLTNRLESQMNVANESLGARSSELEEKQVKLAAQAGHLLQGLQSTVSEMEETASTAFNKFGAASEQVQQQTMRAAQQFQISTDQYDKIADKLETISAQVVSRVANIGDSLANQSMIIADSSEKAAMAANTAQSSVSGTLDKLELMIARIFDAENKAKASVNEMNRSYSSSLDGLQGKLEGFGAEVARHVSALDEVQDSFDEAGQRLSERARQTEGTWQSLVTSAERQQDILQETLRGKIEEATFLLNENAAAIESARDGLYANIEAAFVRAEDIKDELKKMGIAVEAPFEDGVRQVQIAVSQGQIQLSHFMESLTLNASQLGDLNGKLAETQEKAGHKAAETLAGLDAVAARIEAIQHDNMQATQEVLLRLSTLASQLQSRMSELSSTAENEEQRLAEVARQLSMEINGLIHDSQTADTRVRMAASMLSEQAAEVRQRLETQAEAIGGSLDALNVRFAGVAGQMQEIARLNDTGLDGRVQELTQTVRDAGATLETLGGQLDMRGQQIASMQGQLQEGGRVLDVTTQAALDRLSVFTHAMVASQSTSAEAAQAVFARLNDMQEQFTRQVSAVSDGSHSITQSMRGAVADLVEQSVALAAASQSAESKVIDLTSVTRELEAQAQATRAAVEAEASAMQERIAAVTAGLEIQSAASRAAAEAEAEIMQLRISSIAQGLEAQSAAARAAVEAEAEAIQARMAMAGQALQSQAQVARAAVEAEADVMQSRMGEMLEQVQSATVGLERHASIAFDRSQGMAKHFETLSETAFTRVGDAADAISKMADASIAKVEDVNRALSEQAEKVTFAGVHLAEIEAEVRTSAERNAEILNQIAAETGAKAMFAATELRSQIDGLKTEAEGMLGRFNILGQGFASQSATITGVAGELEESLSRMQGTVTTLNEEGKRVAEQITAQTLEFRNEVEGALGNLGATGDALQNRGDFAIAMVHQMASRFAEATQNLRGQFEEQAEHLHKVSDNARAELEDFGNRLTSHTDRLDSTAGTLNESGRNIGETLEKANFLLRNLSTQTDRVKGGVEEIGGALLQKLSEMLCTFEDELKGLTTNTGFGLEELQAKAQAASNQLRFEAEAAAKQIQDVFANLPKAVEENFTNAARHAENAVQSLRAQSAVAAATVQNDVQSALKGTAGQMEKMQDEFRGVLAQSAEALVVHLKQVQESGTGVMEIMRTGTTQGAEEAMQTLAKIRASAEQEVQAMALAVEQNLAQMQNFSDRIREELAGNGEEVRNAATQIFASVRADAEGELQQLMNKAQGTLTQLQSTCGTLAQDMQGALGQAETTTQSFGRMAEDLRRESQRAAAAVADAGQNIASTNTLLQRSQGALFDVAQKSTETLSAFNDSLTTQARNLVGIQSSIHQVAQNMGQTDERLAVLKQGFETIVSEITERLNQGLYSLSKQILSVRTDAEGAADAVTTSSQTLAGQNAAVAQTASALAAALSQLEQVGQTLSDNLRATVGEAEGHTAQLEQRAERIEQHAERILEISNSTGQATEDLAIRMQSQLSYVEQAAQAMQTPIEQFDALNNRLSSMLTYAAQATKIPASMPAAPAPRATAPISAPQAPVYTPPPRAPIAQPAAPQAAPVARPRAPLATEAVRDKMQRLAGDARSTLAATQAQTAMKPDPRRADNELVNSLTQIIQQLEESAGPEAQAQRSKTK